MFRKPTEEEIKRLQDYYNKKYGLTEDELPVKEYTVVVIEGYISDSPGYAGILYLCVFAYPEYHDLLGEVDGEIIKFNKEN